MKNLSKDEKIIWEIYRRLFKNSVPKGDFDELVKNATTNAAGQKEIPFMNYEIEEELMDDIIEKTLIEYKVKTRYKRKLFKQTIYLGCSPKTKIKI